MASFFTFHSSKLSWVFVGNDVFSIYFKWVNYMIVAQDAIMFKFIAFFLSCLQKKTFGKIKFR